MGKMVNIYPTKENKEVLNSILEKYDNENFKNFSDAVSNFIKGKVSTDNLKDMYFCLELIDETDSSLLRPILEDRIFEITK